MFSALQAVDFPSDEIAELSGLDKFLVKILNTDVLPLDLGYRLCKVGLNLIFFLVFLKIAVLEVVDFFLKLCDSLLLVEIFLVFGFCKFNVALCKCLSGTGKSVDFLH